MTYQHRIWDTRDAVLATAVHGKQIQCAGAMNMSVATAPEVRIETTSTLSLAAMTSCSLSGCYRTGISEYGG